MIISVHAVLLIALMAWIGGMATGAALLIRILERMRDDDL